MNEMRQVQDLIKTDPVLVLDSSFKKEISHTFAENHFGLCIDVDETGAEESVQV